MSIYEEINSFFNDGKGKNRLFNDIPASKIVEWASGVVEECKNLKESKELTSTQLRKFYDAIRGVWDDPKIKPMKSSEKLDDEFLARLIFLKPAFTGAAKKGKLPEDFKKIMNYSIDKIQTKGDLYKFVKFFEAIIQYSK